MPKVAAGTLLYRQTNSGLEVLLVHPSGNYNRKAPWSIPKGECGAEEELEATARRETWEETGLEAGELTPLGHIDYSRSRKRVYCFAGVAPEGVEPRCGSWEVDRAEFLSLEEARRAIHPDQIEFLEELARGLMPDR